jgi:hypothetical protein
VRRWRCWGEGARTSGKLSIIEEKIFCSPKRSAESTKAVEA